MEYNKKGAIRKNNKSFYGIEFDNKEILKKIEEIDFREAVDSRKLSSGNILHAKFKEDNIEDRFLIVKNEYNRSINIPTVYLLVDSKGEYYYARIKNIQPMTELEKILDIADFNNNTIRMDYTSQVSESIVTYRLSIVPDGHIIDCIGQDEIVSYLI
jgi:hypothetical protein